jgi:hypothetical protein
MSRLDDSIEFVKNKMVRREQYKRKLERTVEPTDEHFAALGGCDSEYDKLLEKQTRAGKWLCVLLRKRGTAADLQLAKAVEWTAWP